MTYRDISIGSENEWVFRSGAISRPEEKPLRLGVINHRLAKYAKAAGLISENTPLLPADLRRTCGRNAYENGATLFQLPVFLGFTTVGQTTKFLNLSSTNKDLAVDCARY